MHPNYDSKGRFMETNLVIEGLKFMGLGMFTVFTFLVILIIAMNVMSIVIHKFFPEPKASSESSTSDSGDNKKVIAAISAAIKHHRES